MLLSVIMLDRYTNLVEERMVLQKDKIISHEIVEDFIRYDNEAEEDEIRAEIDYINSCELWSNCNGFSIDMGSAYLICTIIS